MEKPSEFVLFCEEREARREYQTGLAKGPLDKLSVGEFLDPLSYVNLNLDDLIM